MTVITRNRGCDHMIVGFTTTYVSVPITTNVVSLNSARPQHYVMKFVSDIWQVGGFNWNIVESGIKHHKPNQNQVSVSSYIQKRVVCQVTSRNV